MIKLNLKTNLTDLIFTELLKEGSSLQNTSSVFGNFEQISGNHRVVVGLFIQEINTGNFWQLFRLHFTAITFTNGHVHVHFFLIKYLF